MNEQEKMIRGLARAAQMIEQRDGGKVWDDEVRVALEAWRAPPEPELPPIGTRIQSQPAADGTAGNIYAVSEYEGARPIATLQTNNPGYLSPTLRLEWPGEWIVLEKRPKGAGGCEYCGSRPASEHLACRECSAERAAEGKVPPDTKDELAALRQCLEKQHVAELEKLRAAVQLYEQAEGRHAAQLREVREEGARVTADLQIAALEAERAHVREVATMQGALNGERELSAAYAQRFRKAQEEMGVVAVGAAERASAAYQQGRLDTRTDARVTIHVAVAQAVAPLLAALAPLVEIADAYDSSNTVGRGTASGIQLVPPSTGDDALLTLADCLAARDAVKAAGK